MKKIIFILMMALMIIGCNLVPYEPVVLYEVSSTTAPNVMIISCNEGVDFHFLATNTSSIWSWEETLYDFDGEEIVSLAAYGLENIVITATIYVDGEILDTYTTLPQRYELASVSGTIKE